MKALALISEIPYSFQILTLLLLYFLEVGFSILTSFFLADKDRRERNADLLLFFPELSSMVHKRKPQVPVFPGP